MDNFKEQSIGRELTDEELMEMTGGWSFLDFWDSMFGAPTLSTVQTEPLYGVTPTPSNATLYGITPSPTKTPMPLYGISPTPTKTPMPLYGITPTPTK